MEPSRERVTLSYSTLSMAPCLFLFLRWGQVHCRPCVSHTVSLQTWKHGEDDFHFLLHRPNSHCHLSGENHFPERPHPQISRPLFVDWLNYIWNNHRIKTVQQRSPYFQTNKEMIIFSCSQSSDLCSECGQIVQLSANMISGRDAKVWQCLKLIGS